MNKPGYNSSIEDKIRWLEWFQSKREINDLETLSKYCNINVLKTDNNSLESKYERKRKNKIDIVQEQINNVNEKKLRTNGKRKEYAKLSIEEKALRLKEQQYRATAKYQARIRQEKIDAGLLKPRQFYSEEERLERSREQSRRYHKNKSEEQKEKHRERSRKYHARKRQEKLNKIK